MPCGCTEVCNCCVADTETVSWTGTGVPGDCLMATVIPVPVCVIDSDSIDFDVVDGCVTGEVIIDPASTASVSIGPDGLLIDIPAAPPSPVPVGLISDYAAPVAPAGWLLCDGSLQFTATYPALFAVTGHAFNDGIDPGAGQFRLPDYRGRTGYGPKTGDVFGDTDGTAGFESAANKTHTHSGPSHTHTFTTDPSTATQTGVAAGINPTEETQLEAAGAAQAPGSAVDIAIVTVADAAHTHTGVTDAAGTGATGPALIPFIIVSKIIKY